MLDFFNIALALILFFLAIYARSLIIANMAALQTRGLSGYAFGNRLCPTVKQERNLKKLYNFALTKTCIDLKPKHL
jgi:hypothetical protein